ncbi:Uncharacterised protein [Staphylococcus devriesei]|nr:Uncharacterised protein [Staphylococcus devriesei]
MNKIQNSPKIISSEIILGLLFNLNILSIQSFI